MNVKVNHVLLQLQLQLKLFFLTTKLIHFRNMSDIKYMEDVVYYIKKMMAINPTSAMIHSHESEAFNRINETVFAWVWLR